MADLKNCQNDAAEKEENKLKTSNYKRKTKNIDFIMIGAIALLILMGAISFIARKITPSNYDVVTEAIYKEETTYIDEYSARNKAIECVEDNQYKLYAYNSNISRIDILHIETAELKDEVYHSYTFSVKGNFLGYDEYGTVEGRYIFDAEVIVNRDGSANINYCRTYKK